MEDQAATFHLTKGSGPVHISGTHQTETNVIEDDEIEELADEEEEEEEEVVEDSPVSIGEGGECWGKGRRKIVNCGLIIP